MCSYKTTRNKATQSSYGYPFYWSLSRIFLFMQVKHQREPNNYVPKTSTSSFCPQKVNTAQLWVHIPFITVVNILFMQVKQQREEPNNYVPKLERAHFSPERSSTWSPHQHKWTQVTRHCFKYVRSKKEPQVFRMSFESSRQFKWCI